MDFLYQNNIESRESLQSRIRELKREIGVLSVNRRKLYTAKKRAVRLNNKSLIEEAKANIRDVSEKIRKLKKQLALCESISESAAHVETSLHEPEKTPAAQTPIIPVKTNNQPKR